MNVVSLLSELAQADIRLWLEKGQLRFSAPQGAMTDDRVTKLRQHKTEIIDFLSQSQQQQHNITAADRNQDLPLSYAQQRLWFLNRLEPDNSAYHIHAALDLQGELKLERLEKACQCIIDRHEILRTRYQLKDGKTTQVIDAPPTVKLEAKKTEPQKVKSTLCDELNTPFDISNGPVMRLKLLQTEANHHILAFTIHHIASDGWSMGIFVSELIRFYHASDNELARASKSVSLQYADYSTWQQQAEQISRQEEGLAYWKQQLNNTPVLDLPTDRDRHKDQSIQSKSVSFVITEKQQQDLNLLAQKQGATLFMSLMAAYAALIHRLNEQKDFAIGSPVAGRPLSQIEQMMGCFVNVLAMRFDFEETLSFNELLQHSKDVCSTAFKHQDVPFEQIVNSLDIERDMTVNPVFQTLLVLQNSPLDIKDIDDLTVTPIEQADQAAQFDLTINIIPIGEELQVKLIYREALFNTESINNIKNQFIVLLENIIKQPEAKLNTLDLYDEKTKHAIASKLIEFNDSQKTINLDHNFQYLFEQQVKNTPDKTAIQYMNENLSYQELNQKSNQLAHYLINEGISTHDKIVLELDCNGNFFIALLAVIKTGACYLPLDTSHPQQRRNLVINDSKATLTLSIFDDENRLNLDKLLQSQEVLSQQQGNPDNTQQASDAFYCIYTSGSTGTPKGVEVIQQSVTNLVQWYNKEYQFNDSDKFIIVSSIGFDLTQKNLLAPLCSGASVLLPEISLFDPAKIRRLLNEEQATVINCAPSVLHSLLPTNTEKLETLRYILVGGEAVKHSLAESVFTHTNDRCQFINMYGPTECTDISSCYPIPRDLKPDNKIYIGSVIQNVSAAIVDSKKNFCPPGQAGELLIYGLSLSNGYLGLEELNRKSFIQFSTPCGNEVTAYRTGDLCRYNNNGLIEYIGRIDDQVKIRGLRIELGEIENQLNQIEEISNSVVIAINDNIAAYYSSKDHCTVDSQLLRNKLIEKLPQYMLPASFTFIEKLPLTASGKINKKALPKPDFNKLRQKEYAAPETETEKVLTNIWQQVLNVERLGVHDNFFELGGHSLNAAEAFSLAQESLSVDIPLKEIFENPTISHIASVIDKATLQDAVFNNNNIEDKDDMESFVL